MFLICCNAFVHRMYYSIVVTFIFVVAVCHFKSLTCRAQRLHGPFGIGISVSSQHNVQYVYISWHHTFSIDWNRNGTREKIEPKQKRMSEKCEMGKRALNRRQIKSCRDYALCGERNKERKKRDEMMKSLRMHISRQ